MPVDHRRVRPAHAAHEQVQHAAEMSCRVIARLSPAQEPVQHNAVQQRLQRIVGVQHRLDQPRPAVVRRRQRLVGVAQPVRLVVDHQVAAHRRTRSTASTDPLRYPRSDWSPSASLDQPVGVGRQRVVGWQMLAQQVADVAQLDVRRCRTQIAAGQRKLEVHLPQPISQTDLAQRHASGQRAQRGVVHRHHRRRQLGSRHVDRPPHRVLADLRLQLGGQIGRERVGGLQHRVHQRAELRALRQIGHRRRHVRRRTAAEPAGCRRPRRPARRPPARCSPRCVSATRISPEYEVRRHVVSIARWKCRTSRSLGGGSPGRAAARRHHRLLDHRTARGLPLPQPRHRVVVGDSRRLTTIGHHRLTGSATAQQPRQPAVGLVARRRPPCHHLRLRSRQRDVGQPAVVAGVLLAAQLLDGADSRDCPCRRCAGSGRRRRGTGSGRGPGHCG